MPWNTRKNTLYNVCYPRLFDAAPLVTAPYLSRVVGTEGVGLYGYSWAISYVFVLIGLLGLENYGPREIARVRDDRRRPQPGLSPPSGRCSALSPG